MNNRRNYPLLLASQFLSAFGDNLILMLILGPFLNQFKAGTITGEAQSVANIYYTSLLFMPYVLLAPLAGYLNDRFSKNRWLLGGNFIKLAGTGLVSLGLVFGSAWQGIGYFTVGIGACVYSPAKYGILPEILPAERLVKANGLMELLTLIAILTGNIGGSAAFGLYPLRLCYLMVIGVGLRMSFHNHQQVNDNRIDQQQVPTPTGDASPARQIHYGPIQTKKSNHSQQHQSWQEIQPVAAVGRKVKAEG